MRSKTGISELEIEDLVYPDSDGQPMSDNTEQFNWITLIKGELEASYKEEEEVFVGGDLLWYPVRGRPDIRRAPDVMVAFGRPKGYRGSYRQWREGGIAPQVVFEIISPKNTPEEMAEKRLFYERYKVEEYYEYDPQTKEVRGWRRVRGKLQAIEKMSGWVSPRLKIRFEVLGDELKLYRPDGREFSSHVELDTRAELAERQAEEERAEKELARERANREQQRAEREKAAKEKAWTKLREMGIDPEKL